MASELHLRIITPDRTVVDRKVAAVRFQGIDGSYGILPHHAPLMTAIAPAGFVEITELDGKKEQLFTSDGFAQVYHNVLTLVCEAGEFATEIDFERAKAAEQRAREKLLHLDKLSEDFLKAEVSLKKALAREMLSRRGSGTGTL
jgi:F-type H+-transporting ATPase subunit epsilon